MTKITEHMRKFDALDWDSFMGCEGENPYYGEFEIDGQMHSVVTDELGMEISWHTEGDECPDHFARKTWNEVEVKTQMASDFYIQYAEGVLIVAERSATIAEIIEKCGMELCQ